MEERLKLFLAMEGLSPSQFADKLGVQRSGVSHLLSGRNKPSFEFISKMLLAFPKINPDWLINGTGKAYRDFSAAADNAQPSERQIEEEAPVESAPMIDDAFPASNASLEENPATDNEPDLFSMNGSGVSAAPQSLAQSVAQPAVQKYPAENRVKTQPTPAAPAKRIAQITILYSDGTYEVR